MPGAPALHTFANLMMTDPLLGRVTAAIGAQYRIENEIGRGGMSVVYQAYDRRLNRTVAIKVLPPELAHDPAVRSRFMREAQTSAQLSHPNIVPIFDVGEADGIAYFVMAHVRGGNLAMHLDRQPLRAIEEVRRVLAEVADALSYAHLRGVIHRDIKADNILLEAEGGRALVTDFGIARAMEGGSRLTQTGIAVGTPTYMSPEQAVGEREIDGRSDVYSLGVVGYQMLTGRVPFSAGNPMALLLKHVSEVPTPVLDLRPETPRALAETVEKALAKTPEARWSTAAAFRDALTHGDSPMPRRPESREPVRYVSPMPRSARRPVTPRGERPEGYRLPNQLELEPAHLAHLSTEQREDLRLWNGEINLLDRVRLARRYAVLTGVMSILAIAGVAAGLDGEIPPLVLGPIVPWLMFRRLRLRSKSLKKSGLKLKQVFFRLRARRAIPALAALPSDRRLARLATRPVLEGPHGMTIRRAATDRAVIIHLLQGMSKEDRALVPEVRPTADALFDRVIELARSLHDTAMRMDPSLVPDLYARHLSQMDRAAEALGNLRLDLVKLRTMGLEAALEDMTSATQQARALSKEIGTALAAAAELKNL